MLLTSDGGSAGGVVILSAEDGLGDTIRPRLEAAEADLERIIAVPSCPDKDGQGEHPPILPDDLDWIKQAIFRVSAKLVVIDPLMAYLSGDTNSHRDQDIRRVLASMAALADETRAAILVIRHLNKTTGGSALYRGGGSIGIIGAARSGLLVARDPDQGEDGDGRVLASIKSNLGPKPQSLSFHLEQAENDASRTVWDGESSHDASALLSQAGEKEPGALEEAIEFLEAELEEGPVAAKDIKSRGRNAGISERTLQRAKDALNIKSHKQSMDKGWVWELAKTANTGPALPVINEGSQTFSNGNLGNLRQPG